ncbi:DUF4159 domain-containing protein [Ancylobacter dichloromethanicus]|uniref:LytTR family transcriptional regulator n=1 Tax=Ancylobacter dichloromethanicus TaxID=518825 RepID=A0A9W6J7U7_9HYPH|nr:DUF4159 domain-containing protein [Ancylobacter dichloromethanicus]MBS7553745.1 DUF4159 domain-containing protein [Ancylobacter dichloromethanicus]GLK70850.1 LytTR family transcriptional regulator [Ancylobacter dichloromethanicus]
MTGLFGLPLAFATPLLLTALAALPLLWFLLRLVPPRPRRIAFAPMRLLLDIPPKEETPARTPWWLTVLRLLLAALIIIAAAGPIWNPPVAGPASSGPVVLLIDSGWPAAAGWAARQASAEGVVADADLDGRGVVLIPTGEPPLEPRVMAPNEARERLRTLSPVPFVPDRAQALASLARALAAAPQASVIYLSDGVALDSAGTAPADLRAVVGQHPLTTLADGVAEPLALAGADNAVDALTVKVVRADRATMPRTGTVRAFDMRGLALGEARFGFEPGATETEARFDLPVEIRNEVARLDIGDEPSAGAVQLLDKRWRRRAVGVVSGVGADQRQPLLAPSYYLTRALAPFADIRAAEGASTSEAVDRFIDARLPVIILSDVGTLQPETQARLTRWVEGGGVLVRFAGPRLANGSDDLVPVTLRRGGRVLGGSLSWEQPQSLGGFSAEGPFRDVPVPNDITVQRQVLAEPDGLLAARTWATLSDGTPLVTGERRGAGTLVLFHVTADTSWSNLPLSGAFVEMLRRVVALGGSAASEAAGESAAATAGAPVLNGETLAPTRLLDGFGAFRPSMPTAKAIPVGYRGRASADHPPGFYGPPDGMVAVNALLPRDRLVALDLSGLGRLEPYRDITPRDLRAPLLVALLALILVDAMIVFLLAGGFSRLTARRAAKGAAGGAAVMLLAFGLAAGLPGAPAQAQTAQMPTTPAPPVAATPAPEKPMTPGEIDFAVRATSSTRLAYVITGDADTDAVSRAGLKGLTDFLGERTALEAGEPMGVDVARDELSFFPLLYWPIVPGTAPPSPETLARIDAFMKQGGTVVFDTRDAETTLPGSNGIGSPANDTLRAILSGLDIPELEPVPRDHVLTKAFYLLRDFPGRFTGGTTWVEALPAADAAEERPARAGDGVSPVVITSNDLAGAWAVDEFGQPLLPVSDGGPRQRELAFRAGANLVMYVLTGNYKADQVHVPALLERLGQ